jgi:hypothetical protein
VVVIEHIETIAVPVYVPVPIQRAHRRGADRDRDDGRGRDGDEARRPSKPSSTEYWGYGGKLRPDAWGQPQKDPKKDPEKDPKKDPKKK